MMRNEEFTIDKTKAGDRQKRLLAYQIAFKELQKIRNREKSAGRDA